MVPSQQHLLTTTYLTPEKEKVMNKKLIPYVCVAGTLLLFVIIYLPVSYTHLTLPTILLV